MFLSKCIKYTTEVYKYRGTTQMWKTSREH